MRFTLLSEMDVSRTTRPAVTKRSIMCTMVAPETASMSASSDCDKGGGTCAAAAIVIQLARLMPQYLSRRSIACRQPLAVLCNAFSNRSARSVALPELSFIRLTRTRAAQCQEELHGIHIALHHRPDISEARPLILAVGVQNQEDSRVAFLIARASEVETALRGLLSLCLCIELLSVVIQGLEQVGHLGKRFEHCLLIVGGVRVHGIYRRALLGAQRAGVENRCRQTRDDAPRIARPVEQPVRLE